MRINKQLSALPETNELKFGENGKSVLKKIEPISMKLLHFLVENRGVVCSNADLINNIWDGNQEVGSQALRKNIYKLRSILKEIGEEDIIVTIPKKGYKIEAATQKNNRFPIFKKLNIFYILGIIILIFVILKIIFPGILHRLMH